MDKFIIFCAPRSGSTVVGAALFQHSEILYYGELFHQEINRRIDESSRKTIGLQVINLRKECRYSFKHCANDDNGYEYINDFYSRSVPFKAIGFKLLSNQALRGGKSGVWDYIAEHPEIKIIHIRRENMLDKICSLARGEKFDCWHLNLIESMKSQPFVLSTYDFKRCLEEI